MIVFWSVSDYICHHGDSFCLRHTSYVNLLGHFLGVHELCLTVCSHRHIRSIHFHLQQWGGHLCRLKRADKIPSFGRGFLLIDSLTFFPFILRHLKDHKYYDLDKHMIIDSLTIKKEQKFGVTIVFFQFPLCHTQISQNWQWQNWRLRMSNSFSKTLI